MTINTINTEAKVPTVFHPTLPTTKSLTIKAMNIELDYYIQHIDYQ